METKEFLGKLIKHNTFGAGEIIEARNIKGELDTLISLTIRFEDDNLKELVYPFIAENKIVTFMDERFSKKIDNELYKINNEMSTNKNVNNKESSKSNYWQNKNEIKKFSIFKKLYEFIKSIFVRPKTEKSKSFEDNQTEDLKRIEEVDCIVVKSFPHCDNLNHSVENIRMIIELINEKDQIIEKTITGTYCKTCNKYYIVEPLFKEVLRFGMPNCNIEIYDILSEGYGYNQELKEKSILKEFGYSVGKKENLTEKERQHILGYLIDYEILSKSRIISYLEYFISQREYSTKDFSLAINKWQKDLNFVNEYRKGDFRKVFIKNIKIRK